MKRGRFKKWMRVVHGSIDYDMENGRSVPLCEEMFSLVVPDNLRLYFHVFVDDILGNKKHSRNRKFLTEVKDGNEFVTLSYRRRKFVLYMFELEVLNSDLLDKI